MTTKANLLAGKYRFSYYGGSSKGIRCVFLGLNTVRRFATRGRTHNRRGSVHRCGRSNDWNGYDPHRLT